MTAEYLKRKSNNTLENALEKKRKRTVYVKEGQCIGNIISTRMTAECLKRKSSTELARHALAKFRLTQRKHILWAA